MTSRARVLALLFLALSPPAVANVDPYGAFTTEVSVEVPAFHGIEPAVGLRYTSHGGNGVVGVGWQLEPSSVIVRASPGGGVPAYGSSDIYMLDGQELVPCSVGSRSPSCSSAITAFGTSNNFFSTAVDDLRRIEYEASQDAFIIWSRNGTQSIYQPQGFSAQLGTYRWALTRVIDVHANIVDYDYTCDSVADQGITLPRECYLDKIRYVVPHTFVLGSTEGAVIKFHYEQRDDVQTYSTGHQLAIMRKRLKTIEVRFAAQTVRAYALTYVPSTATGASVLASVQQFPRDATVNALGVVTAGATPPRPPMLLRTSSQAASLETWEALSATAATAVVNTTTYSSPFGAVAAVVNADPYHETGVTERAMGHVFLDVDGDERADYAQWVLRNDCSAIDVTTILSDPNAASVIPQKSTISWPANLRCTSFIVTACGCDVAGIQAMAGDLDGDHREDLVLTATDARAVWNNTQKFTTIFAQPIVSQGNGSFVAKSSGATTLWQDALPPAYAEPPIDQWNLRPRCSLGDTDGDGMADLVCTYLDANGATGYEYSVGVGRSDGHGDFEISQVASPLSWGDYHEMALGDLNADGRADVMITDVWPYCDAAVAAQCGCTVGTQQQCPHTHLKWGVSNGAGDFTWDRQETGWLRSLYYNFRLLSADINGDGRADFVMAPTDGGQLVNPNAALLKTAVNTSGLPAATVAPFKNLFELHTQPLPHGSNYGFNYTAADLDGDGRSDLLGIIEHQPHGASPCSPGEPDYHAATTKLMSNGDGTFAIPAAYVDCVNTADNGWARETADVNGDGIADLAGIHLNWITGLGGAAHPKWIPVDTIPKSLPSPATGKDTFRFQPADVNGDGREDFVYVAHKNPGYAVTTLVQDPSGLTYTRVTQTVAKHPVISSDSAATKQWQTGDIDGDGRSDLVLVDHDGTTLQTTVLHSLVGGGYAVLWDSPWTTPYADRDMSGWRLMDVNRDGYDDLVHAWAIGTTTRVDTLLGLGNGKFGAHSEDHFAGQSIPDFRSFLPMDLNGDGCTDLVHLTRSNSPAGGTRVYSLVSNCTGGYFTEHDELVQSTFNDLVHWTPIDANSDGLTDLAYLRFTNPGVEVDLMISLGNGKFSLETSGPYLPSGGPVTGEAVAAFRITDINGDGRSDFVLPETYQSPAGKATSVFAILNEGRGRFVARTQLGIPFVAPNPGMWMGGDTDADGRGDLTYVDATQIRRLHWRTADDRLYLVENGYGGVANVTYGSSAGRHQNWPSGNVTSIALVESRYLTHPGGPPSSVTSVSYTYEGLTYSVRDRRSLGFHRIVSNDGKAQHEQIYVNYDHIGPRLRWSTTLDLANRQIAYTILMDQIDVLGSNGFPILVLPVSRHDYECEKTATCRDRSTQDVYDTTWFHRTQHYDWGLTGADDDRFVEEPTIPNATSYIVDRPALRTTYGIPPGRPAGSWQTLSSTVYLYDGNASYAQAPPRGDVTWTLRWNNQQGTYLWSGTTYDADGNVLGVTDPLGNTVTTIWDPDYNLFDAGKWTFATGSALIMRTSWDYRLGRPWKRTDVNNQDTLYEYDNFGGLRHITQPDGSEYRFAQLGLGTANQRTRYELTDGSADGVVWREVQFDGFFRPIRSTNEGGATEETDYADATSNPSRRSNVFDSPGGRRDDIYTYDDVGRLTEVRHADGSRREIRYDVGTVTATDEVGHMRGEAVDGFGRRSTAYELLLGGWTATNYRYDALDRITAISDALGHLSTFAWDSLDRRTQTCDPDRGCIAYDYYANDLLYTRRDAIGQVRRFTYDGLGRMRKKELLDPSSTVVNTAEWFYDVDPATQLLRGSSMGRVTQTSESGLGATARLTYDVMGRVVEDERCNPTAGLCFTSGASYDLAGRLASLRYPDQKGQLTTQSETVTYTYDDAGELATMPGFITSFTHEPDGRPRALTYQDGTTRAWGYDPTRGWLTDITSARPAGVLFSSHLDRAPNGRIDHWSTTTLGNALQRDLQYDDLDRLTSVRANVKGRSESYSYDAIGNMMSNNRLGPYTYGDPAHAHAVTMAGAHRYSYDANGNMILDDDQSGTNADRFYAYDGDDRMTSSYTLAGPGIWYTTFHNYDADGERIEKYGPNGTTYYFGPLVELAPAGNVVKHYYAAGERVARRDDLGLTFLHTDHRGSLRVATVRGNDVGAYDYDTFGREIPIGTPQSKADRKFAGEISDLESRLVYMGARFYDPLLARFVQADSLIPDPNDPQSLNRYSYVRNDPARRIDPDGHRDMVSAGEMVVEIRDMQIGKTWRTVMYRGTGEIQGAEWEASWHGHLVTYKVVEIGTLAEVAPPPAPTPAPTEPERGVLLPKGDTAGTTDGLGWPGSVIPPKTAKRVTVTFGDEDAITPTPRPTPSAIDVELDDIGRQKAELRDELDHTRNEEQEEIADIIPFGGVVYDLLNGDLGGAAKNGAEEGVEKGLEEFGKKFGDKIPGTGAIMPLYKAHKLDSALKAHGDNVNKMKALNKREYDLKLRRGDPDAWLDLGHGFSRGPDGSVYQNGKPMDHWGSQ